MDLSLVADTFTIATKQGLGFARFTNNEFLRICAAVSPVDTVAPPRIRPTKKNLVRTLHRFKTKKIHLGGGEDDGSDGGFFDVDGGDFDGPFDGGYGGGGRWNFDGFGGFNWNNDDFSSNSSSGPAFDFFCEVICWIAPSICLYFALKKIVKLLTNAEREKVIPMRLTSVC